MDLTSGMGIKNSILRFLGFGYGRCKQHGKYHYSNWSKCPKCFSEQRSVC